MELWLVVFLGPLIVIGAGAALVKAFQVVFSSDSAIRALSWRGLNAVVLVILTAFGLVVIAGLIALWQISPWLTLLGLAVTAVGMSRAWAIRHRRSDDDPYDERRHTWPTPP